VSREEQWIHPPSAALFLYANIRRFFAPPRRALPDFKARKQRPEAEKQRENHQFQHSNINFCRIYANFQKIIPIYAFFTSAGNGRNTVQPSSPPTRLQYTTIYTFLFFANFSDLAN